MEKKDLIRKIVAKVIFLFLLFCVNTTFAQNNWVYFTNSGNVCPSYVQVGNINIPGNQLTVEAKFVKIPDGAICGPTPYPNAYDIVSKHYDPTDDNYLLRPDHAELSTTNGAYATALAPINYNTCYYIAMVYDGSWLKFYLNGTVYDSVACTGNLLTNSWITNIGFHASVDPTHFEQFFGYVDEVRIWNVARTRCEIQTYMNQPLPNPTTQVGLLGYYNFDNGYTNIEGNTAYDGVVTGNPVRIPNPDACAFAVGGLTVSNDTTICPGQIVTLTASGANTYSWSGGATTSSITVNPSITTKYYVYGTTCSGVIKDSITVSVSANGPNLTVSKDTTICAGQIVNLTASGASTYSWSGGATTSSITVNPTTTTKYYVYGSNACGIAKDSVTVQVSIGVIPLTVSKDTTICSGQLVTLTASGASTYSWSGGATTSSITVNPATTTTYYVTGSNSCGNGRDSVKVNVLSNSKAAFNYSISPCSGEVDFTNQTAGYNTYYWDFGDGNSSTTQNAIDKYATNGLYLVTLFINKGTSCADSIQQTINYSRDSILALHVPNVFTPNGDGKNDVFKISGLSDCKIYNLTIYNRWGMKVFETSNPISDFWNGHLTTPTGPAVPAGIYYYVLSGDESFAGFVTVIH